MLLAQKNFEPNPIEINEAIRLFSGVADLDFELGYNDHTYFQHLLVYNTRENVALLEAYHPEEIVSKYIIRVAGSGFILIDHHSEVYGIPDAYECIDGNLPLRFVLDIDAKQKPNPTNPKLPFLDGYKFLVMIYYPES